MQIDIAFCGVCHSDLHTVRSEWPGTLYPCVPGHEIVGRVSAVGDDAGGYKIGDVVGVGGLVGSCKLCAPRDAFGMLSEPNRIHGRSPTQVRIRDGDLYRLHLHDNGKPVERPGRKATGLKANAQGSEATERN